MKYRISFMFASSVAFLFVLALPAGAYWVDDGIVLRDAADSQETQTVIADGAGGAYVIWVDYDGLDPEILAQKVNERGEVQWTEGGLTLATPSSGFSGIRAISDGNGGAFLSYSMSFDRVYVRRFGPDGPLWSRIVSTGVAVNAWSPDIACDGAGGVIVCWQDDRNGNYDIFAQRYDSEGNRLWTTDGVIVCQATNSQRIPKITPLGADAVIVWEDHRGPSSPDLYAQKIDTTGVQQWGLGGTVVCDESGSQDSHQVTNDNSDQAVVVWVDDRNGNDDIYAQALSTFGALRWTAAGEPVCTTAVAQADPQLAAFGPGGVVITWEDYGGKGPDWDIKAQYLEVHGVPQWHATGVPVCSYQDHQRDPRIIANFNDVIIVWNDERDVTGDPNVYAQMIDDTGAPSWTLSGIALTGLLEQRAPLIASDGDGGAIVAWVDESVIDEYRIRAQRIFRNGRLGDPRPRARAISDIGDDEGGYVRISLQASDRDLADIPAPQISLYNVWRRIVYPAAMEAGTPAAAPRTREELLALAGDRDLAADLRISAAEAAALGFPPGTWESTGLHPAMQQSTYAFLVPTRQDSSQSGTHWETFVISAHTSDPGLYFVSFPDSGYSVDNVAPAPPVGVAGEQAFAPAGLQLTWAPNTEGDLWHYSVYRGTDAGFTPGPGNLVGTTADGELLDTGWTWDVAYWYKISAIDRHGNESLFAVLDPATVTGDDPMPLPDATYLGQNYPNPFNPNTTIAFGLKESGFVNLSVFDAAGRLVAVLIDESRPAGQYAPVWNGNARNRTPAASGVYFYRLMVGDFIETKKMILIR